MYCQKQKLKTLYRICCPCELWAFPSHQGEEMPALVLCKSCGWTEAKEIPLPPPPPSHHHPRLSLWVERSFWNRYTHTHKRFPSDLHASSCPSSLGSWSCWDSGVGEILSPLCSPETKWIKWTRFWSFLRSHRGEGRDGERSWGWRRKGRARNSVTQVVCATCTSVPLVRKQECSFSPWDNVPVWYPLLVCDRRASYSQPLLLCFLWKILVGEVVKAGNWNSWVSFYKPSLACVGGILHICEVGREGNLLSGRMVLLKV